MDNLISIMEEIGIPFAYDHFAEGESPEPPFICLKRIRESKPASKPCWTYTAFSLKRPRSGSRANGSTKSFIHLSWR